MAVSLKILCFRGHVLNRGFVLLPKLPVVTRGRSFMTSLVNLKASENASDVDAIRDLPTSHIPTNVFQKFLLTAGSAYMCLKHASTRPDMIAVLGETTGRGALESIHEKMKNDEEGSQILRDQPRINSRTVDLDRLSKMPIGSLGRVYTEFLNVHKITPDSRRPVQFVDDPDLAYVMQRYREVHDLVHALLGMPINMLGEVTVKWVEGIQTGLPMCVAGALFGPLQLSAKQRKKYVKYHLPWAVRTGYEAKFLMTVYFEKRWEQPVEEILNELNIKPLVVPK
ncbi:ubiquinone biosynthesis protein COQ4 homolog, mitochondrial-like [Ischnura elegans]|uniref:ubiquinone biosynthesis protein COQ4 homolog, mitochondrial-like n=1 Tax=Ischnura elegans TaxID=197161 RepID=UPI001ED89B20|nr:ubiquinone biosynthesis protein COQ4 homolog, mitochondrial-like [Ischnura elegans]